MMNKDFILKKKEEMNILNVDGMWRLTNRRIRLEFKISKQQRMDGSASQK